MATIWMDLPNLPEIHIAKVLVRKLPCHRFVMTTRDYGGLPQLAKDLLGTSFSTVGRHAGRSKPSKAFGTMARVARLLVCLPHFDISLGFLGIPQTYVARARGKRSVALTDNDFISWTARMSLTFSSHMIVPKCVNMDRLQRMGANPDTLETFDGFKEDLYLADFMPSQTFQKEMPLKDFIIVRPEALRAEYVSSQAKSMVPELLMRLERECLNVLYLPRYPEDRNYAKGRENVHIPPKPVNGLDACYHSRAVLTGSGTFAREAAILGIPSVSFYPGSGLLSVDNEMVARKWMIHSRDTDEIVGHVLKSRTRGFDRARSRRAQSEVLALIERVITVD